ncbi:MAG: DHH family phosphoesterase [Clostridia bacterium]|nr:DHH family phosphoesterase [Clostridia bacterium]
MNSLSFEYTIDREFYENLYRCLVQDTVDNFRIVIHSRPDGDAVGSGYALAYILNSLGKRACVVCYDDVPKKFEYITDIGFTEFEHQFIITVDVADMTLIGNDVELPILCAIDHHMRNSVNTSEKFVKSEKASCGEIIFEFALFCGVKFDSYLAKCLHTAISTDTGSFKYEAVTENTFLAAAYLARFIPREEAAKINLTNFDIKTKKQMQLECYAVQNIHLHFADTVGICIITDGIKEKFGADDEDTGCISQIPRQIDTVESSFSIKQKTDGTCKVSMRTKEYVDAAQFCSNFGGGGHKRAAGCTIQGTPAEVENKIIEMYRKTIVQR